MISQFFYSVIRFFSSLKTIVVLLILFMILVFVSTLAQVDMGIYHTKKTFFSPLFVTYSVGGIPVPVFPGGLLIGILLVISLIAAHFSRFKWTWRKSGIWLTHMGLIILIAGSGIAGMMSVESQVAIEEGQTKYYSESLQLMELAVEIPGQTEVKIVSIPQELLRENSVIHHDLLPFDIRVLRIYPNSQLQLDVPGEFPDVKIAGRAVTVWPAALTRKDNLRNMVSAYVTLESKGESLGTWLLSGWLEFPQIVQVEEQPYYLSIRPMRYYTPYSLTLQDFTHDIYPGTTIPRNFSSKVYVADTQQNEFQEALIYMNHPLRYRGKTYYQASYGKDNTLSVLQVVENPGWILPYVSSAIIALGLAIQFLLHLGVYLRRKRHDVA